MAPLRIDTAEFTRRGEHAEGSFAVSELPRLASLLEAAHGSLAWRLDGRSTLRPDGSREGVLRLQLDAEVTLRCVRCLEPVEVPLAIERSYRLVPTEEQAERDDLDDEAFDLLVGSRSFDLGELIEDEAILALPPAPRHDTCGHATGVAAPARPDDEVHRPFAALKSLRRDDDTGR